MNADDSQRDVVDFLSQPKTHGGNPVERITTHGAHVFLSGDRAYKLKRAVKLPFMDFSTVERRQTMLEREFRINRGIGGDIYLGVEPIVYTVGNGLRIGGVGDIVDWVLVMRRFAQHDLLDDMARRHALSIDVMEPLADAIVTMHRAAPAIERKESEFFANVALDNITSLRQASIDQDLVAQTAARFEQAYADLREHLEWRSRNGYVRLCHGDLHLRNIVFLDGRPLPFDALEFDDSLATGDVYYDLAFLLMDLDYRGFRGHANRVLNRYVSRTDDIEGLKGLPLFMATRAAVRAKVAALTATLAEGPTKQSADEAVAYLRLAGSYLPAPAPRLVAVGGLSGTGKTRTSLEIAPSFGAAPGAIVIRSDIVRKQLAGVPETTRLPEDSYTPAMTARVYDTVASKAGRCLASGYASIVDAVFAQAIERSNIERIARDHRVPFTGCWLGATVAERLARIEGRRNDASDANSAVAQRQETFDLGQINWHAIDANGDVDHTAKQIAAAMDATGTGLSTRRDGYAKV